MRCATHGYLFPEEVQDGNCIQCGKPVSIGKTEKMSKSLKNVVDPDYLIIKYGADTTRLFCLFASPPEKDLEWSDQGVDGAFRFLNRTWRIVMDYLDVIKGVKSFDGTADLTEDLKILRRKTHQTIKKVTSDIEDSFHFNTAISAVMELVNVLYQVPKPSDNDRIALGVIREAIESIILLLAPIVPHITEELWMDIGRREPLADAAWPSYDPAIAAEEEITIVIQINGKLRSRIDVSADEEAEKIKSLAVADEKIVKLVEGKQVLKVVYVPKKLVNIVVRE
jgi:leucyl-tRNA synthetase